MGAATMAPIRVPMDSSATSSPRPDIAKGGDRVYLRRAGESLAFQGSQISGLVSGVRVLQFRNSVEDFTSVIAEYKTTN